MKRTILCFVALAAMSAGSHSLNGQSSASRIEIHAKRFSFQPSEITLKKGETTTLALTSDDVPHSLLVEGLHINTSITKGHTSEVTVTPDQTGDFKGRCGKFCGSGHGSMTFVVHVVEK
jgi:cytochrome c oxidase subunit II